MNNEKFMGLLIESVRCVKNHTGLFPDLDKMSDAEILLKLACEGVDVDEGIDQGTFVGSLRAAVKN